jgi:uncharacterized damage-inducible protein DinB
MNSAELLADAFGRIHDVVHHTVGGLSAEQLADRPTEQANSIAWLVWHLTRVQDDHVADAFDVDQVWTARGWAEKFDLPFDVSETGYGFSAAQVASVRPSSADLLTGYYDAVHEQTLRRLSNLNDADLDRVVDQNWNPPVTLGVRLISVISDDLQHAGQAAYASGLIRTR